MEGADECGKPGGGGGSTWHVTIPVSHDPNEMGGPVGFGGEARYVLPGEPLDYTVYFENQSTASAAAQQITIDLDLSEHLDWSTFTFGEIDLAGQSMKELAGRQRGEVVIPLKGRTDFVKAVLTFK
ncbi:MAG: hypothetical protein IJS15_05755, partial [Victivallales bacterium]|nr:hypothetical protein [Victivallales bacterium]